jgi:hypothetical protein
MVGGEGYKIGTGKSGTTGFSWEDLLDYISRATDEQICRFLKQSFERFQSAEWEKKGGDRPWRNIAETALHLWESESPNIPWMDHAFDLQHDSGTVFNKMEYGLENQWGYTMEQILDRKRNQITNLEEMEQFVRDPNVPYLDPESAHKSLESDLAVFHRIYDWFTKELSSLGLPLYKIEMNQRVAGNE